MERIKSRKQRKITKRIIIKGQLILDTPTCLSSGELDDTIDLVLLRDSIANKALLTGSSIAGALRNYLREYKEGYEAKDFSILFGCQRSDDNGEQSPLIIDDALSKETWKAELRDGVKINSITRTAESGAKYDLELLEAGTIFNLCFELLIDKQDNNEPQLLKELAIALSGLEKGEISIGMKKRRGFGRCHIKDWQVWYFNLEKADERTKWLNFEHWRTDLLSELPSYSSIEKAFTQAKIQVDFEELKKEDKRDRFTIDATFSLASPLLIRSGQNSTERAPDVVHLKSYRPDTNTLMPVLSGTSLAGVLRHRAERIINTLHKPLAIIEEIFGINLNNDKAKNSKASRLVVDESIINETSDLVQTRIAIDRFTGGTYQGALFDEQPVFGKEENNLKLELELKNPKDYEIGLLLLLLKDLWTEDLPVGGTSSIGRGRLQGKEITLKLKKYQEKQNITQEETWIISQTDQKQFLQFQGYDPQKLESFVTALVDYPSQKQEKNKDE